MELCVAMLVKTSDKKLADFIFSMWDEDTQPLDEDEVSPEFRELFLQLEFEYTPTTIRQDDTMLFAFFDCVSGSLGVRHFSHPYFNSGIDFQLIAMFGDEGGDWYKCKNNKIKSFNPKYSDDEDLFVALRKNAEFIVSKNAKL